MDFKVFYDGLISASLSLFLFSFTLMISAIFLKPYLAIEPIDRDFIVILCVISIIFSTIYFFFGLRTKSVFKLESKYILKFMRTLGVINLIFTPHFFFILALFTMEFQDLLFIMIALNISIELILIGIIYKEIIDLFLREESEVKFEIEKNQKLYFEKR